MTLYFTHCFLKNTDVFEANFISLCTLVTEKQNRDTDSNMKGSYICRTKIMNYYKENCVRSFENENYSLRETE
jgi:hypothetical protein